MENSPLPPKHLNDKGQCCGRKPIVYKRAQHLFCPRCDADYNMAGEQIENWAFKRLHGGFRAVYPTLVEADEGR